MLWRRPKLAEVTEQMFRSEMIPVNPKEYTMIDSYISVHRDTITKFEFGHIRGRRRVFRVTHSDGTTNEWDLKRRRHKKSILHRIFR